MLGHSRLIWARFVMHQPANRLRCHIAAFETLGGASREVLYDRMKTAVIGEGQTEGIIYNRGLIDLACHYGFHLKAFKPYRAKTKGKVERPFRYIREGFFLARSFRNLDDLNAQLRHWLDISANPRKQATTLRFVNEAFAEERPHLRPLSLAPLRSFLRLERRVSREGMVSVGGNTYSVPDATRSRMVEVHSLANEVRIFENGTLIALILSWRTANSAGSIPIIDDGLHHSSGQGHEINPLSSNPLVTPCCSGRSPSMMRSARSWHGRTPMRNLLKKHPDVAAIYNVEGGNAGMAKGSEEAGLAGRTRVVTHEENSITVPLMRDDVVQYVLAQDPAEMLRLAVNVALVKNATPQGAAPCRFWPPYAVQSAKICAGTAD